jgi:dimethylglycine dehydrogenase
VPKVGRVKLSYMLTPKGKVWSEATIARLSEAEYLLCGPTLADQRDFDWLSQYLPEQGVSLSRGSHYDGALMVMGPESRQILQALTDTDLDKHAFPWMTVQKIILAGVPLLAMRLSYVGELGWELHLPSNGLSQVYEAIMQQGADKGSNKGLVNFGSYALNAMRVEKGYHGWGADFGIEYTPKDVGIERFVNTQKPDFVGREAVLENAEQGAEFHFTGFVVESAEGIDPLGSDPILQGDKVVGYVSSSSHAYRLGGQVALGYITIEAQAGDQFVIESLGYKLSATVAELPFYDPENLRLRG